MWNIVRASVLGTSHLSSGFPCQDHCYANCSQEYLICLVADGAGSAKQGGMGAELACRITRERIEAALDDGAPLPILDELAVKEWICAVQQIISKTAEANGLTARDYACTLLGAVIGTNEAVFFQIGDGAIVASNGSAQGVVFWPKSGMYANMTHFVTDSDASAHLHIEIVKTSIKELSLFSDGLPCPLNSAFRMSLFLSRCWPC